MENSQFNSIKIGLASPETIRAWSYGEVKKPETINYRTLKPERDGLFCERIFGPTKDWECHCGKYKRIRYKGKICDRCGVEVTKAKVRRERMGHIELAAPVSHIWYFKGIPSRIGLMLDISPRDLERVLYFACYIVTDPGRTPLEKKQILTEAEYRDMRDRYEDEFKAGMGAESIKSLLCEINLEELAASLREEAKTASGQKRVRIAKRLDVVDAFVQSNQRPEWMILDVLPVIPPDLRPMVQLDGGRFATSDLNDLYRRVINRNNRLKRLNELGAPDIIVRNEKRMLQEAVDALIDNGRRGRPVTGGSSSRQLKSLSDLLKGKQGRFRQNLLGKRVDYSGRSVIVVGPDLKLYQCGLPKEMALELFKPFVMKHLVDKGIATNIKSARKMVDRAKTEVWDSLEAVIKDHPVMLNRAPTLHRLGIQAFEPVLVEGRAIKLHPLACTAFNADFDGDQMAVHVPLSAEAQTEARFLMLCSGNLLKPASGAPINVPTQDMVLGSYYLSLVKDGDKGEGSIFRDIDEAMMAYQNGDVTLHAKIKIRLTREWQGEKITKVVDTTLGRVIFNSKVPQDLGLVERNCADDMFKLEVDELVSKKTLGKIISACIAVHGIAGTSEVLDAIKNQGFDYSTKSGITVSVQDAVIPPQKKEIIAAAEAQIEKINKKYARGTMSSSERYKAVIETWQNCTEEVADKLKDNLGKFNPIYMMADSGARGSMAQIRQLAGMRGLIANTSGATIEIPIRSNYREGLNILEYFISSRGARKGLTDTALRTADSGYLTRRLVDVSQEVIIREEDCGATEGIDVSAIMDGAGTIESFAERMTGRFAVADVYDPKTGELIIDKNTMIDSKTAKRIEKTGIGHLMIRSVLNCRCKHGVCRRCYGANMANGQLVGIGEAVGIVAAQSIGEPGTQLTMRNFHSGGVASDEDITQGLPRVEELFEARKPKPKNLAILTEISGVIHVDDSRKSRYVVVTGTDNSGATVEKSYLVPYGVSLKVHDGDIVTVGDMLTDGLCNPHDILAIKGKLAVQNYLISEVQRVYRMQGVDINDKHIETICRQMMRKVRVLEAGDTDLMPSTMIDLTEFEEANKKLTENTPEGQTPNLATCEPVLLGITKAALNTDSFLSAASFQETTRILTDAAIKKKTDNLLGLKENVIIGKLIPAGTGLEQFNTATYVPDENFVETASAEG